MLLSEGARQGNIPSRRGARFFPGAERSKPLEHCAATTVKPPSRGVFMSLSCQHLPDIDTLPPASIEGHTLAL